MAESEIMENLAHFICNLTYHDLPSKVIVKTKTHILDTLGCALAGYKTKTGEMFVSLMKEFGGREDSTIFGDGCKVPSPHAAFINGILGHIHELDDGHRFALGHPGVTSIPSLFSVAEQFGSEGKEVILATVLGYEVFARIAQTVNPSHRERGFHTTGTCGTFGATVSAGKILHLTEQELCNAMGIAGCHAAGLMEVMRGESRIKPINAGRAAHNGVLACLLAKRGITAPDTILEGTNGFFRAYSDRINQEEMVKELGQNYKIMGAYIKLHAACRHTHPAIDCILELQKRYQLHLDTIKEINVGTYSAAYKLTGTEYNPQTESTAKFSIPYCLATALIYGKVGLEEFTPDKITDKQTLRLAQKVKVEVDPKINRLVPNKRGASVEILMKGGERYEWTIDNPKGEPEVPATNEEVHNKFRNLARTHLSKEKVERLITLIENLEDLQTIEKLITSLS